MKVNSKITTLFMELDKNEKKSNNMELKLIVLYYLIFGILIYF